MRLPRPVLTVCAVALLAGVSACGAARPAPPEYATVTPATSQAGHPNVVLVLADDLDTSLLRFMPHVQQMQTQGVDFAQYSVADTLCCPSRSSILTGRYPHDTGVFTNSAPDGGFDVFHARGEEQDTVATALQRGGYHTALMGKYLNGYQPDATEGGDRPYVPPGWNVWDVAGNGYPEYDYDLNENGVVTHHGDAPGDYMVDVLGAKGGDFIRAQTAERAPFFLEVATFAPHGPYTPAPRNAGDFPGLTAPRDPSFDQVDPAGAPSWLAGRDPLRAGQVERIDHDYRLRAQAVEGVDAMLGHLQDVLAETGQARNTVVMFTSDNGYHMGQHRLTPGKQTAFDTDLRVPLVVSGPGFAPGARDQLAQNVDLAPTITDLAGTAPVAHPDGQSLAGVLRSPAAPPVRGASLVEHHGPNDDPADPDRQDGRSGNPPTYTAITTGAETWVEYLDGQREYYDRRRDPFELHSAAATLPPARADALHATLTALAACHGAPACAAAGRSP